MVDKFPVEPPDDGYHWEASEWVESEGKIVRTYVQVITPEPVHTYKKSYLAQWMRAKGKWETFLGLLSQSDDLNFFWNTSTEFDSNHEAWPTALYGIKVSLNLSDGDISEMLAYGETGNPGIISEDE